MKNYYRVMLGRKSMYAEESYKSNFIGAGFILDHDLSNNLVTNSRDFNDKFVPIWLSKHPDKTKISAALSCGMLWTVAKGIQLGDTVLCPDGNGNYYVGEVIGNYEYHKGANLPHHRAVRWYPKIISRNEMSQPLRNSTGSIATISNITKHANEIEELLSGTHPRVITTSDETIENPNEFALEEQLEEFLMENWKSTELGKNYEIYEEDGDLVGQQYSTDVGEIDILTTSKDKKTILVIELKRGRASDIVVGQCLRYMGYVRSELAEDYQNVRGMIIAHEDDIKIRRALSMTQNIDFYTYKIDFQLIKKN